MWRITMQRNITKPRSQITKYGFYLDRLINGFKREVKTNGGCN